MSTLNLEACLAAIAEIEAQQAEAAAAEDDAAKRVSDYVLGKVAGALREAAADQRVRIKIPKDLWDTMQGGGFHKLHGILWETTGGTAWEVINRLDGNFLTCGIQELAAGIHKKKSAPASVSLPIVCRYGFVRLTYKGRDGHLWVRMHTIGSIIPDGDGGTGITHNGNYTEVREGADEILSALGGYSA